MRALASHHCGLGLIYGLGVTCMLSFSLVLFPAPMVFRLLDLTNLGPGASLSALLFSLDMRSGDNQRFYTYSLQLAEEVFKSKHEAIV